MRRFIAKFVFVTLVFFVSSSVSVFAQEAPTGELIRSYATNISVERDGRIVVREEIVYDFGNQERHGIIREIPTDKVNDEGTAYRMKVEDISVKDGDDRDYQYEAQREDGNLILKIGDPDRTISGVHTYVIGYSVSGALSYFTDADELYWNVVGTDWEVPIGNVSATVFLPQEIGEQGVQFSCFTGERNSPDTSGCLARISGPKLMYSIPQLAPGEGFTTAVQFPAGFVRILEPEKVVGFFETFWGRVTLFGIITLVILWYIVYPLWLPFRWWLYGRDPKHQGVGETSAWFDPPKIDGRDLSALETGALVDEKITLNEFTALIIQIAQKGYMKIEEKKKNEFHFHKLKEFAKDSSLQKFEKVFLTALFGSKSDVKLKDVGSKLVTAVQNIEDMVYEDMVHAGIFPEHPNRIRKYYAIISGLAAATFNILLLLSAGIFGRIMPRKTLDGVHAANVAKSMKNFITSQERQFAFQADRQMMFEKLLPYAVAFGVEKIWAERFKDLKLSQPEWFRSSQHASLTTQSLTRSISRSFTPALRASATPTRSTSGFSSGVRGGSVGGGGGGGGGRSW